MQKQHWNAATQDAAISETDAALASVVRACNQLRTIADLTLSSNAGKKRDERVRWRQTCSQTIAMPRDVLRFDITFSTHSLVPSDRVFQIRLTQQMQTELVFDRIDSVQVDGVPTCPTHQCGSRTFDLHFNRIFSGQSVKIAYFARVCFDAEPFQVRLSDLNMNSSGLTGLPTKNRDVLHRADAKHGFGERKIRGTRLPYSMARV